MAESDSEHAPMSATIDVRPPIETSKVYMIHGGDNSSLETIKEVTEHMNQEGITVYTGDRESARKCGYTICLLPPTEKISQEQEDDIIFCYDTLKLNMLVVGIHGIPVDKYITSTRVAEIISSEIMNKITNTTALVALMKRRIRPSSTLTLEDTKILYKAILARDRDNIHYIIIIKDNETENKNIQSWLESMNYQRRKEVTFERKAGSVTLFLLFYQSGVIIERTEVTWNEVDVKQFQKDAFFILPVDLDSLTEPGDEVVLNVVQN